MVCPRCCGLEKLFDKKHAVRDLARYRRRGPIPSTRLLIDLLRPHVSDGVTLLDIGGGIGAIQHELLEAGAANATDVDVSPAYLEVAREEAERRGHADRIHFRRGDFVDVADTVEAADIVTLDRVICCYDDMHGLVSRSAGRARRLYGLVYPRGHVLMWLARPVMNTCSRIRRCPFRFYLHRKADVDRVTREAGLTPCARATTFLWQVVVYERNA